MTKGKFNDQLDEQREEWTEVIKDVLRAKTSPYQLGTARMAVHPIIHQLMDVLEQEPNHVAYQDRLKRVPKQTSSLKREEWVIEWCKSLYNADHFSGEMTSGATESTITSLWMMRNYYLSHGISYDQITILVTPLTHYSVHKACDLLSLHARIVPVNDDYAICLDHLRTHLFELSSKEHAVILVLTMGYTATGTMDDIESVCDLIEELDLDHVLIHVDAAIQGLIYPLLSEDLIKLTRRVKSITFDFHKSGGLPYGSGVHLFDPSLKQFIRRDIPYVHEVGDSSLLSSRSGTPALFAWAILQTLGKTGLREIFQICQDRRDSLLEELKKLDLATVYSQPKASHFALVNLNLSSRRLKNLYAKYKIDSFMFELSDPPITVQRIYINNTVTPELIQEFIQDLSHWHALDQVDQVELEGQ